MIKRLFSGGLLLALMASSAWGDAAFTVSEVGLRLAPEHQSHQVATLPTGTKVELKLRQGGWYQVEIAPGRGGWLPLLSVRKATESTRQPAGTSGLKALLGSYRTGSSGVTVATGVRGLDAVDLKNSQPDMVELAKIDQYTCSAAEAQAYAASAGLVRRNLAWLPSPDRKR